MLLTRAVRSWWGLLLLGASVLWVYADVFSGLARDWWQDDNYSHGLIVIPVAAYLAWSRRTVLKTLSVAPSAWGLVLVAGSLMLLLLGTAGIEFFLTRISVLGVLIGTLVYLVGWGHVRALAFPLAFLSLMIPLPAIVFNQIVFPLQLVASRFGVGVLQTAGVPVLREGNVIVLANTTLEVAEACSGIRSLISLLTFALLYGYLVDRRPLMRVLIAASSIPVAILANGLRVAATGAAAHHYGPSAITGFLHEVSGLMVFLTSLAMLIGMAHLVRRVPYFRAIRSVSACEPAAS